MAQRFLGAARAVGSLPGKPRSRPVPDVLVRLVSRLLVAQAGATAAIGLGYSRRSLPWLVLTIVVAVAVSGLAWLVRSGGHGTWLVAIGVESGLAAVGLFSFAYSGYAGGTLLSLVTLGTLLHPAVARNFAVSARWSRSARQSAAPANGVVLANGGADARQDPAMG